MARRNDAWRPGVASIAAAAAIALGGPVAAGAQDAPPVFRSTSELVAVQVSVFAEDGGPGLGLSRDDFVVLEDGRRQSLSVFLSPDSGPLEIALLIDASGSMVAWPVRDAALALLDALDPGSCVMLMPFKTIMHPGIWGYPDDPAIRSLITRLRRKGDEAIYDALLQGMNLLRTRAAGDAGGSSFADLMRFRTPTSSVRIPERPSPSGECTPQDPNGASDAATRRAIVLLTDSEDTGSQATIDDVILAAWGGRIPVFVFSAHVQVWDEDGIVTRPSWERPGIRALKRLVEYTGGVVIEQRVFATGQFKNRVWEGIERLVSAVTGHYTLGFVPEVPTDPKAIDARRRVEVRVPDGYEALFAKDLAVGSGASYGAALDVTLNGFAQLGEGNAEGAVATFERAASLHASMGIAHYGRSSALLMLGRPHDALEALDTASALTPWLPDLNARKSFLLLEIGDGEGAWEHAIKAYLEGANVSDLIELLQARHPRQIDLQALWDDGPPRIVLGGATGRTPLGDLVAPLLFASIGQAAEESETVILSRPQIADYTVMLDLKGTERRKGQDRIKGHVLLLDRESLAGQGRMAFEYEGLPSESDLAELGQRVVDWIVDRVR